jgi:acetoin utilization protein AcuB
MLVGERMTRDPVTIRDDEGIDEGLKLMRDRKVRRLPVLDRHGRMIGIVADTDLLHAAPSPVSSLSVYEMHYLLARLKIKQVMTSPVITVNPDTPLEDAARIMVEKKIGGLPVIEDGKLVGIITETDIFKILLELLGAWASGLRLTVSVQDAKGVLAQLTRAIADLGGNIISLVIYAGTARDEWMITIKVTEVEQQPLRGAMERLGYRVVALDQG